MLHNTNKRKSLECSPRTWKRKIIFLNHILKGSKFHPISHPHTSFSASTEHKSEATNTRNWDARRREVKKDLRRWGREESILLMHLPHQIGDSRENVTNWLVPFSGSHVDACWPNTKNFFLIINLNFLPFQTLKVQLRGIGLIEGKILYCTLKSVPNFLHNP